MPDLTPRFITGMILLVTNQPVGWGGIIYFSYLAKKTGKKIYIALGTVIYAVSWGMLALGAVLAGPEGLAIVKDTTKKYGWKLLPVVLIIGLAVFFFIKIKKKK